MGHTTLFVKRGPSPTTPWLGGDLANPSPSTALNFSACQTSQSLMPHERTPFLSSGRLELRSELEELLLTYDSVIFASIGFHADSERLLVSVGTGNHRLAVAEAGFWTDRLAKRGLEFEVQILKGRSAPSASAEADGT